MKLKVGDRVRLISIRYLDHVANPKWDGRFGKTMGTVISICGSIEVEWDNKHHNSYHLLDLAFVEHKSNHPLTNIFI